MPGTAALRATWVPSRSRRYLAPGGAWRVPDLDTLLTARPGELVDGPVRLGPEAMEALVARVAGGLAARGVRRGGVVTWQLPNGVVPVLLLRACWRLGAVAAPVLHTLGPSDAAAAIGQVDAALHVDVAPESVSDPEALLDHLPGAPLRPGSVAVRGSDVALALFTSGSTGVPKAVLHTHRGLSGKAASLARAHGLTGTDTVLVAGPLSHISGLANGVLVAGAVGLRSVLMRRFDPGEALALVGREHVTFTGGPPTFLAAMAGALGAGTDVTSLRLVSLGGAPVAEPFVEGAAERFSCRVKRSYGSTEAPIVTTSWAQDPAERVRDSDGRAVGEVELAVFDPETGTRLAPGQVGELWIRGPELFAGYSDASRTAPVIAPGGWFRTADLATLDGQGWLRIVGRMRDLIIRGGENVYAAEVEAALHEHPIVREAVVVGYPDDLMGERVAAFVVTDGPFDLHECRRWFVKLGMARFKTPERVVRLDHLPVLGTGKSDRGALAALAAGAPEVHGPA